MVHKSFARSERISDLIQATLGSVLIKDCRDPRFRAVSISRVDLQADLKKAHIFFTLISEEDPKEITKLLNKAAGFFRQALSKQTELKYTPILEFIYDSSIKAASDLSKLIDNAQ